MNRCECVAIFVFVFVIRRSRIWCAQKLTAKPNNVNAITVLYFLFGLFASLCPYLCWHLFCCPCVRVDRRLVGTYCVFYAFFSLSLTNVNQRPMRCYVVAVASYRNAKTLRENATLAHTIHTRAHRFTSQNVVSLFALFFWSLSRADFAIIRFVFIFFVFVLLIPLSYLCEEFLPVHVCAWCVTCLQRLSSCFTNSHWVVGDAMLFLLKWENLLYVHFFSLRFLCDVVWFVYWIRILDPIHFTYLSFCPLNRSGTRHTHKHTTAWSDVVARQNRNHNKQKAELPRHNSLCFSVSPAKLLNELDEH